MSDGYLNFANSKVGSKLTQWLGLPQPMKLARQVDRPHGFIGKVLIGGAGNKAFIDFQRRCCKSYLQIMNSLSTQMPTLMIWRY